jgi:hypothetical protein
MKDEALRQCIADIAWLCGSQLNPLDSKGYKMAKIALGEMEPEPEPEVMCAKCGSRVAEEDMEFSRPLGWRSKRAVPESYITGVPCDPEAWSEKCLSVCKACDAEYRARTDDPK